MQKIMFSLLAISLLTVGNLPVFAASVSKGETVALAIAPLLAERDDTYIQKFYEMLDSIIQKFSNDEKKSALLDDLKEVLVSKVPIPNINISNTVSNTTIINNTYNTYTNNDNSNNSINTNNATNTNNTYTDNSKTINNISVDNSTHQNQDNSVNHTDNSINVGDTNKGNTSNNENSNTPTTYPTTPNTPVSDATLTLSKNVQTQNLMIQEEQNITLATIPIQVQNGDVRLQTLELDGNFPSLDPFRVELKINGNDIGGSISTTSLGLKIDDLDYSLSAGSYNIQIIACIYDSDDAPNGVQMALNRATITYNTMGDKSKQATTTLSSQYLIVKGYPVLALINRGMNNTMSISVINTSNYSISFNKNGIGMVGNAEINIDGIILSDTEEITIAPGESMKITFTMRELGVLRVQSFTYDIYDADNKYTYTLTPTYANVGNRSGLQLSYR